MVAICGSVIRLHSCHLTEWPISDLFSIASESTAVPFPLDLKTLIPTSHVSRELSVLKSPRPP